MHKQADKHSKVGWMDVVGGLAVAAVGRGRDDKNEEGRITCWREVGREDGRIEYCGLRGREGGALGEVASAAPLAYLYAVAPTMHAPLSHAPSSACHAMVK